MKGNLTRSFFYGVKDNKQLHKFIYTLCNRFFDHNYIFLKRTLTFQLTLTTYIITIPSTSNNR